MKRKIVKIINFIIMLITAPFNLIIKPRARKKDDSEKGVKNDVISSERNVQPIIVLLVSLIIVAALVLITYHGVIFNAK